ncbi:GLPGLI family protein [Flavobacterium sp.]|uniref:GLPGLI family protein n=1 Tax=Flavobacterium sp. TaxID=239 RepID=UPI0040477206
MNKKILILTIILTFFNEIVSSQTIKGIYIKQQTNGIGDDSNLSKTAKEPEIYEYIFSENSSSQILINKGKTTIDTIRKKHETYDIEIESTVKTIKSSKSILIKDFKNASYEMNYIRDNEETYIKDKIPVYNWEILEEYKEVNGFKCKKATTIMETYGYKLNITAWFSEEIPINDGPITFNGLPGLILELNCSNLFIITFRNFTFDEKTVTKIPRIETNAKPQTVKEVEKNYR